MSKNSCWGRSEARWIRCAMVLLPVPRSPINRTGTELCASSRTTASTACILGLTASNNCGIELVATLDKVGPSIEFCSMNDLLMAGGAQLAGWVSFLNKQGLGHNTNDLVEIM